MVQKQKKIPELSDNILQSVFSAWAADRQVNTSHSLHQPYVYMFIYYYWSHTCPYRPAGPREVLYMIILPSRLSLLLRQTAQHWADRTGQLCTPPHSFGLLHGHRATLPPKKHHQAPLTGPRTSLQRPPTLLHPHPPIHRQTTTPHLSRPPPIMLTDCIKKSSLLSCPL